MLPAEFEPAIPAKERPQAQVLDRATTAIGTRGKQRLEFRYGS
jgi:hypothetical protein